MFQMQVEFLSANVKKSKKFLEEDRSFAGIDALHVRCSGHPERLRKEEGRTARSRTGCTRRHDQGTG
jgi:hypothetical protein